MRRSWTWIVPALPLLGIWLIGQLVQDRTRWSALCFYVPTLLITVGLVALACLAGVCAGRRGALVIATLALGPLAWLVGIENRWSSEKPTEGGRRFHLLHWNVWHGTHGSGGWLGVRDTIKSLPADICILSESPGDDSLAQLTQEAPKLRNVVRFSDLAVLADGRLNLQEQFQRERARAGLVEWRNSETSLTLLVVDLPSSIQIERDPLLRWVRDLMDRHQPDIVVGDFNAPRRSASLNDLPAGFSHAYDRAGSGWSYTWPAWVPLWAIDQCIIGKRIVPHTYELLSNEHSDHRMQLFEFSLSTP